MKGDANRFHSRFQLIDVIQWHFLLVWSDLLLLTGIIGASVVHRLISEWKKRLRFEWPEGSLSWSYLHARRFRRSLAIWRHSMASASFSSIFTRISSRRQRTPDVLCFSTSSKSSRMARSLSDRILLSLSSGTYRWVLDDRWRSAGWRVPSISGRDRDVRVAPRASPSSLPLCTGTTTNNCWVNTNITDRDGWCKREYLTVIDRRRTDRRRAENILGLHTQETAERKHVVLHASHCRSSSGISSKHTRSPSNAP